MDKATVSQYLYDEYCKEYSGAKEWGKPPYKEWLEQKLFEAQIKSQKSAISPVSARICYSWIGGADKNFCATVEEGSQEQIELQKKMDESKRLHDGRSTFRKMYVR